jgi:putative hydrolase of the HAD superfamily
MIKAIIWDLGGVLSKMADNRSHRYWEKNLGLQQGELAGFIYKHPLNKAALIGEISAEDYWLEVGKQLGLSSKDASRLHTDFFMASEWDDGLLALIESLKANFKMAILSGAMSDARANVQSQINTELFDVMIFSAEEGVQKPDPEIYQRALARLGVEAEEAIFIDDWLASVEGARGVGIHAIHYVTGIDIKSEITRIIAQQSAAV